MDSIRGSFFVICLLVPMKQEDVECKRDDEAVPEHERPANAIVQEKLIADAKHADHDIDEAPGEL